MLELIGNLFGAVKEFFGFQGKRLDLKNGAAMQQAAAAQTEAEARDKTAQAIAQKDTDEIRKELAE